MNQELLKNPTFTKNVQLYLARYRHDQERMFRIFEKKIEKVPKMDGFECAAPSPDYLARFCFIVSMMSPELWNQAKELWKSEQYFIIEPNPDAINFLFQTRDLTEWLSNPKFHFFLGYPGESVIAPLQRVLRQTVFAGKIILSQVLAPNETEGIEGEYLQYAQTFHLLLRKTVDHIFFNFGHIDDSIEGLRATFQNFKRIQHSGGITELEGLHKGKAIAVIGAGPSLDQDIELLSLNQDKFIIVAVDAAIKPLLKANCRIDYVTTIERYNGLQEPFFEGLPELQADLVCYPVVHRDVIKLYPNTVRFAYRNYAWFAYFEKNWPLGILESGGSASHLAARLALHLGAEYVVLVGCDMTYERSQNDQNQEVYRSHCRSTAFPEWDRFKTEEEIRANPEFYGFYDVEANDGSQVKTHQIYHQWAKEYSTMIMAYKADGHVLTTAKLGIKTPRLIYIPLKELVEIIPKIDTARKTPMNARIMRQGGHEIVLKNIKGLYQTMVGCIEVLEELQKNPEIKKPEMFELCFKSMYEKLVYDTFFTAFIIQNSAMEFFRQEARYYAIPDGPHDDGFYSRRVDELLGLYRVLEEITAKTIGVIEDAEKKV